MTLLNRHQQTQEPPSYLRRSDVVGPVRFDPTLKTAAEIVRARAREELAVVNGATSRPESQPPVGISRPSAA